MPNANTDPQALQGVSPSLHSREDGHAFARLRHLADVVEYARRNAESALARSQTLTGTQAKLWRDAAQAFGDAMDAMQALQSLPESEAFARAKELLHEANHLADEAESVSEG